MRAMAETVTQAMTALIPELTADYAAWLRRDAAHTLAENDNRLSFTANDGEGAYFARQRARLVCRPHRTADDLSGRNITWSIDDAKIEKLAAMSAEAAAMEFARKLSEKLAGVEDVTVDMRGGGVFNIMGRVGGRTVRLEQRRIIKVSSKGNPFHQWPARIYVDGQFTPEATFRKMFG